MFLESNKNSGWPRVLAKKNLDFMINSFFKNEFVKRCNQKVQQLYQMPDFAIVTISTEKLDWLLLETIITDKKESALLLSDLVLGTGPISYANLLSGYTLRIWKL